MIFFWNWSVPLNEKPFFGASFAFSAFASDSAETAETTRSVTITSWLAQARAGLAGRVGVDDAGLAGTGHRHALYS